MQSPNEDSGPAPMKRRGEMLQIVRILSGTICVVAAAAVAISYLRSGPTAAPAPTREYGGIGKPKVRLHQS